MLKRVFFASCLAFAYLAASAQQPKMVVDQIVAVIGSSAILYSDVDRYSNQLIKERKEQSYTSDRDPINESLEALMLQKLLYNQALIDSVEINDADVIQMVDDNLKELTTQYGSASAVEAFYRKPIYEVREDLRQRYTEIRYAQSMQREIQGKVAITPGEVERYYKTRSRDSLPIVPEQYIYAQITKFPPSITEAKQRVREKLLEIKERILSGSRFDVMARMYSADPGSAARGGEMDPMTKESFVAPFADALSRLKPGQISEVVETDYGYHIIQLIGKEGNLYRCRHILMKPVYTNEELKATTVKLDSVAQLIKNSEITFDKAALEYSDDKFSKLNGGIVSNHELLEMYNAGAQYTSTRFPREDLPQSDSRIIMAMKVGDISTAFMSEDMRGNELGKIIKLVQIIPTHPANINEDYLALENLALQDKQNKELRKWLDKKIKTMYVRIDPAFRNGEFDNKNWVK